MQNNKISPKSYEPSFSVLPKSKDELLPRVIWILIGSFLPTLKDMSNLLLVSKYLHSLTKKAEFWQCWVHKLFPSNSISKNISDHQQLIKNQIHLFKDLPGVLERKRLRKLTKIPEGVQNHLCPFKPEKAEMGYTVVWREENKVELLCRLHKRKLYFVQYNPEEKTLSETKAVLLPLTEDSKESDIVCASVAGNILCLGINYKVDSFEPYVGMQKEVKLGMVVLVDRINNIFITSIEKQCKFVEEIQLSEDDIYVKITGAKKPFYEYTLKKESKCILQ